jgi:hypothetical protein
MTNSVLLGENEMKKSKLIAMLNALEGDPDIKMWNGMVGDWMEIDPELVPQVLVRQTLTHWLEMCRLEECSELKDWSHQLSEKTIAELEGTYPRVNKWEMNPYVTQEDVNEKRYKSKNVLIMQAKPRGINTFDRVGYISY